MFRLELLAFFREFIGFLACTADGSTCMVESWLGGRDYPHLSGPSVWPTHSRSLQGVLRQGCHFEYKPHLARRLKKVYSYTHTTSQGLHGLYHDHFLVINLLTPNDHYSDRTAPLTSKGYILYIYSTNIGTEYFKHGIYCPFFPLQNAVCFINLTYLVPVLFTFYMQGVLKFKKIIPAPKG